MREWQDSPVGLLEDLLWVRVYAQTKAVYDQRAHVDEKTRRAQMQDPMMRLVHDTDLALAAEEQARLKATQHG